MVFGAVLAHRFLYVPSLFRCGPSALWRPERDVTRTVVEACEANLEPEEGRQAVSVLESSQVHFVFALEPDMAQCLEPGRGQDLDVFSALCNIAVFGAVGAADNEVRYVRGEIKLDGSAHLGGNASELRL
jgi:hypothetical protein